MSTLRSKYFFYVELACLKQSGENRNVLFFRAQIFRFSCFQECRIGRDQRSKVNNYTFSKKDFCYGSCKYVSTLRKKIFSVAEVKCFRLQGSNYSDFFVFGNASLGKIKGHSLTAIPFQKIFLVGMKVSGVCLPYVKRLFSVAPVKCFFLQGSNYSDSVVFRNPSL